MTAQANIPKAIPRSKGIDGLPLTAALLGALVVLFVGERLIVESTTIQLVLDAIAGAGVLLAIVARLRRRSRIAVPARKIENLILLCYVGVVVAIALYVAQADFIMEKLRPSFSTTTGAERYQVVLMTLWPIVLLCAIAALGFIEISYATMDVNRTLEPDRIVRSARSGLFLALTVCLLLVLNYICLDYDKKADLSYFKTTAPSESSKKMVENLSQPLKVYLFYPGANEVQDEVQRYFDELKQSSKQMTVKVVDHVLDPDLAKELSVSDNGYVVLKRDQQNEKINIGTDLKTAKGRLKKLDSDFQQSFARLQKNSKVAYFTVGHEERTSELRDDKPGTGIQDMRMVLQRLNYTIKDLGIGQGLADQVPADASVVIVVGPRKQFMPAEELALRKYLEGGGKLMLFLDAESDVKLVDVLRPFGLSFTNVTLANDRFLVRVSNTQADRFALYSNRFSSHPTVSTLSRNSSRVVSIMMGAGALEEVPPAVGRKTQVQFTVHSMPFTWNDLNKNMEFDAKDEQRKVYELGAAVTMKVGKKPAVTPPGTKKKDDDNDMRMVVFADSEMVTDQLFRNPGNGYLVVDGLKWLVGEEEYIGETTSEEDIRIVHTRKEDTLWFYLTILGMPALVLCAGLFFTIRRRKRS